MRIRRGFPAAILAAPVAVALLTGSSSAAQSSQVRVTVELAQHAAQAVDYYCSRNAPEKPHQTKRELAYALGFCEWEDAAGYGQSWLNGRNDRLAATRVINDRYVSRSTAKAVRHLRVA